MKFYVLEYDKIVEINAKNISSVEYKIEGHTFSKRGEFFLTKEEAEAVVINNKLKEAKEKLDRYKKWLKQMKETELPKTEKEIEEMEAFLKKHDKVE